MARLPTRNRLFRAIWTADSYVSSALFETWAWLKRAGSAYSSFMHRYFRLGWIKRGVIAVIDDGLSLGIVFALGLLAFALPPFSGTGDVWNSRREYAVTFTDVNGDIIGRRGIRQDDAIPLDEISPHLIKAVLATEDARFFEHFGVDVIGTMRALYNNTKSKSVQGGSSITQQVAKNLFLSPKRTLQRKVHEAFLSLWIEARISKEEILKLYLDRSYLGGGTTGVEAASQFYFGKSVRDVTLPEAAILAGLFKAPTSYAPHQNLEASRRRSNVVLYRMLSAGMITQGELLQARRSPATIVAQKDLSAPNWFLDFAYQDTLDVIEAYGLQRDYVIEVKTTIDRKLQSESQAIVNDVIDTLGTENGFSQAASITMAPDGAVKAVVGGRDYETSQFNRATKAERQSGSSFKPFVYLAALLDGFTPEDVVVDGPVSIGGWSPGNYKGYDGKMTLTTALAKSANSIPVKLMQAMGGKQGIKKIVQVAHDVGVQGELETWPPMVLGTSALTLLDITTGYATFANGGRLASPHAVLEIRRPNGDLTYSRSQNQKPAPQVAPEDKIAELNMMMGRVVTNGTARSSNLGWIPSAGKTGTNQSYRDAWYIGYTKHNVTGVWVGNDDFTPMNDVTGGRIPAPTWKRIMEVAEAGQPAEGFAGVPVTEEHIKFAENAAKEKAETQLASADTEISETQPAVAGTETAISGTGTEAPAVVAAGIEEAPAATPEQDNGEDVNAVLNGMFDLFEKPKTSVEGPRKAKSKSRYTPQRAPAVDTGAGEEQTAYIIPRETTQRAERKEKDRDFLDRLFGKEKTEKKKKKKKKKKKLLFFDF